MGTVPVSAAAPAALLAAMSPLITVSVIDDRLTASGFTLRNPVMSTPHVVQQAIRRSDPSLGHCRGPVDTHSAAAEPSAQFSYSYCSGEPISTPSISPSVVTSRPRPGGSCWALTLP